MSQNAPKKCPRKFTQKGDFTWTKASTRIHQKVSARSHPLKMSTKICPLWKKVSTRSQYPRNVSIPETCNQKRTLTSMWSTLVYLHFKYLYLVKSTYATYVIASRLNSLRGHSQTTLTRFWLFLTTYPLRWHFLRYECWQKVDTFGPPIYLVL